MANKIRSEYIKNLVADKKQLDEELIKNTKDSIKNLLGEAINQNLREILSEKKNEKGKNEQDDYQEEDVMTSTQETEPTNNETPSETETAEVETTQSEETPAEDLPVEEPTEEGGEEEGFDDLEQFSCGDGEYDCTGMNDSQLVKVFQSITPQDGVRVVMKGDKVELTDDNTEKEYIIDLGGDDNNDFEDETEMQDLSMVAESENLGYTDNYQNKTAMTMDPDNGDDGDMNFNAGAPKGSANNTKRWVGNAGDMKPYKEQVYEVCLEGDMDDDDVEFTFDYEEPKGRRNAFKDMKKEFGRSFIDDEDNFEMYDNTETEVDLEEQSRFGKANERGMHKTLKSEMDQVAQGSHVISRDNGEYEGTVNENLRRKAKAIMNENKELRKIAGKIREQLSEATVVNASLAKIVKLVTENSTTKEEKLDIINRFNNVKTIDDTKRLYEQIEGELKKSHTINNVKKTINGQLTEAKNNDGKSALVETTLLNSDLKNTISLMERMESLK